MPFVEPDEEEDGERRRGRCAGQVMMIWTVVLRV